jgi:hypothetical protein
MPAPGWPAHPPRGGGAALRETDEIIDRHPGEGGELLRAMAAFPTNDFTEDRAPSRLALTGRAFAT